jgi:cation transport protein ChaC
MADAVLRRYARHPARLAGYRRAFLHESRHRFGTPEAPCPILGIAPGDECWGLAFDIPEDDARAARAAIEKREAAAERRLESLPAETAQGVVKAWVWVSRESVRGAERDLESVEPRLRAAHGIVGTGVEYVRALVHALDPHGIKDPLVDRLWERLSRAGFR